MTERNIGQLTLYLENTLAYSCASAASLHDNHRIIAKV